MLQNLTNFAQTAHTEASGDIFSSLGINWQMLTFQMIAFIVLVVILGKFVFPVLMKSVDERQSKIEAAGKAAEQAEKKAEAAEAKIEDVLKKARSEAADIVATAKNEAVQMVEKAESQAKSRSDRIVAEAHEEVKKDVLAARKSLEKDTIALVKKAAGLAVASIADDKLDTAVIKKSVEGARR